MDPDYREPEFHATPEHYECSSCGAGLSAQNPSERCDCGKERCQRCTHHCEWCNADGCESCMTNTIDGWAHTAECAAALKASEDRKNAAPVPSLSAGE